MEQLIKKIQKLREWEHLGLITTTGNVNDKGLNEFLMEMELDLVKHSVCDGCDCESDDLRIRHLCPECCHIIE